MSQTSRTAPTSQPSQSFPYWPQSWVSDPQTVVQHFQRLQEDAQAVQRAAQNASIAQIEDMFEAINSITRIVGSAAQSRNMGAMIAAQPEIFQCLIKVGQTSQERIITMAGKLGSSSLGMPGIASAPAAPETEASQRETSASDTQ